MKFLRNVLVFIFLLITSNHLISQEKICGFDLEMQEQLLNPKFIELNRLAEEKIQNALDNPSLYSRSGNILTVPVVVHVLHLGETVGTGTNISDAQIQSSIDHLNYFYRGQSPNSTVDFEIEFVLAQRDPNCNATTGINRIDASSIPNYTANGLSYAGGPGADRDTLKDLSRWPETAYFNIWVVTEINGNNGGGGFQGFANFYTGAEREGSMMMYSVLGYDPNNNNPSWPLNFSRDNSTVVHEVGHYFHLYHTFQGDDTNNDGISDQCPTDTTVGLDSDGCIDTEPHLRETSTCPVINSCSNSAWIDNNTINNIMSYYNCSDRLTEDQKTRSRAVMEGTSLVNSRSTEDLDLTFIAPSVACTTNTTSGNFAGVANVELNGTNYKSSTAFFDGGNLDYTDSCYFHFDIDTGVSNTLNVSVVDVNFQQLGVWIDWNNDGDFDDADEQQYIGNDINDTTPNTVAIPLILPTVIPYDTYVRMRLVTDLDDRYGGVELINSACYSSLVYGQSEDYNIYVKPEPITYTYNNAWLPSNPIGVSTIEDAIEIITGNVTLDANTICNTLTVEPGATLNINSGVTLSATVNLNSTSQQFASLISDGSISGTVNYHRYTSQVGPVGTNDLIAAPVSGDTFGDFATLNLNLAASGTLRAFGPYDTQIGDYINYDTTTNVATLINAGIGYRAATTDGSTLTFTGTVRTGDVLDVPISDASVGFAWNLIGNPYPSYIDFDTFFQENKSELDLGGAYQAIYGYDGDATNGWTVWNQATIDDGNVIEVLAPGQGFFVKSKSGGGLIDFTTAMRTSGSTDDFISGRQPITNVALCKLDLSTSSKNTSTMIYFIEGTTRGLDNAYDAGSYLGSASEFSIYSNLVEDNTGIDLAIQTLPYTDFNDVVVPLGINAQSGEELVVSINPISTLPENINVYLEDMLTNTVTLLNTNNYSFTPLEDLSGIGRFYIRYTSSTLSTDINALDKITLYTTSSPKTLVIKGQLTSNSTAELYDIQGRIVLNANLNTSSITNIIDVSVFTTGIYIVKIVGDNQTKTQKLIIK